ncbi:hypothetical protein SLEP1_g2131 [Rubroshorea leprosula]|uniref:Uncharacterized protein n=1 Tax=Rubroshorea leprosula TaxID=152421 RepID=A0AAV5HRY9_9ROSI|nr:hypothetical protein SLEP1_g2131 [Rubroshorea leprosula]
MAMGKYSKLEGRKSSSYCSTVTIVVVVALFLVGVWMLMSSSVNHVEKSDLSSQETTDGARQNLRKSFSKQFEDNVDSLSESEDTKKDDNDEQSKYSENNAVEDNKEEKSETKSNEYNNEEKLETNRNEENNEEKSETVSFEENNEEKSEIKSNEDNKEEKLETESSEENNEEKSETESNEDNNEEKSETKRNEENDEEKSETQSNEENNEEKSETENNGENRESEISANEKQDDSHLKESTDERSESEEEQKKEGESDGNREDGDSNSEAREIKEEGGEMNKNERTESDESSGENRSDSAEGEKISKDQDAGENNKGSQDNDQASNEVPPNGGQSEILSESTSQNGAWSTQAVESEKENSQQSSVSEGQKEYNWKVCKTTAGPDYIPCLDNWQAIRKLPTTSHYEHRERHCPYEPPTCLVPLPEGYRRSVKWPKSRDKVWYNNVPHTKLAEVKGHQNWVKVSGEYLTFPGGGTQFTHGALHYVDFIQNSVPEIAWGKRSRVILDVGCGVASFGGYLFERDVLAMSFAPKDEHEAQVQFALERGIPAMLSVMGTKRLPFPSSIFDLVHCARCRVPWHIEGGKLLLELNRVLRPGGYFVWSATPVYRKLPEDAGIWKEMSRLTKKMCWDMVSIQKDKLNGIGAAIYRKPTSNECYDKRNQNDPPLCEEFDDPNAAWNVPLQACMHRVPVDASARGSHLPEQWPQRLEEPPYWLNSQDGVYGKAAPEDFVADYNHWKAVVSKSYLSGIGINWSSVRNVMDMRAVYGGFAAALKDLKVWVMNVVPIDSADTLPIIYERGLFGIYHDWCESFNTYPRSYDLLHADHLFSSIRKRCNLVPVFAEVDRILRPEGKLIVRDDAATIREVTRMANSLNWEVRTTYLENNEGFICLHKTYWRPNATETVTAAIV